MSTTTNCWTYQVVNPSDSSDVWHYKVVEDSITGKFYFTEVQNTQGFVTATELIPDWVLEDIVQSVDAQSGSALKRFEKYELLLNGTFEVGDANISPSTGTNVGSIESGKTYLIVLMAAGVASGFDLGTAFEEQKLLFEVGTPTIEYLDTNFANGSLQSFEFVFGTDFSADDDYANAFVQALLNDIYLFVDKRGNVYEAFQGNGQQGGHWALYRVNEGF